MTTTNSDWYERVGANTSLTQGDVIMGCPIATWADPVDTPSEPDPIEALKANQCVVQKDVIVMTQACDLANRRVRHVVLCPHYDLVYYRDNVFVPAKHKANPGKGIDKGAFKSFCSEVTKGFRWNLFLMDPVSLDDCRMEHRIVDFHEVFSIPLVFLEMLIPKQNESRFRLLSPYREHLSQSFARSYMRVGLPTPVQEISPDLVNIPENLLKRS